jgi:Na+-driven multidrug efflux pump
MISHLLNAVILVFLLTRERGLCRFHFKQLCLDKRAFLEILHVGLPSGIQSALFSISNMIISSSILRVNNAMTVAGSAYQPVINGNSAAANLENFVFTAVAAVHQGTVTFTGQNAGAKRYDRVRRIFALGMLCSVSLSLFFTALLFILRAPLFALYGVLDGPVGSLEHIAFQTAELRFYFHLLPLSLYAFFDTSSAVARGLKRSISSAVITLIGSCFLRIVWIITVFERHQTLDAIYVSYPLSWAVTGGMLLILVLRALKKESAAISPVPTTH